MNVQEALATFRKGDNESSDETSSEFSNLLTSYDEEYSDDDDDTDDFGSADGSRWRPWLDSDSDLLHYPFTAQNVGPHFSSEPVNVTIIKKLSLLH